MLFSLYNLTCIISSIHDLWLGNLINPANCQFFIACQETASETQDLRPGNLINPANCLTLTVKTTWNSKPSAGELNQPG